MEAEHDRLAGFTEEDSLDERIDTAVAVAFGQAGYVTEEGERNLTALCDTMTDIVVRAVAEQKSDRAKVGVTRREIMTRVFPTIVGPEGWADQDEPELAKGVYKALDEACWRLTATKPDGQIQARLNSDHGLVLCRTRVNPHNTEAVYVTRDLGCLLEDAIKPQRAAQKARADRDAAFTAMLIERVPEHGKRFNREMVGGLSTALNSAKAITAGVLETSTYDNTDESSDVEGE